MFSFFLITNCLSPVKAAKDLTYFIVRQANDTLQTNPLHAVGKLVFSVQYIYTAG